MQTRVVHLKKEPYDVNIGRPSKWGNPYSHKEGTLAKYKVATREEAVRKYREYIYTRQDLLNDLHELKGKVLGCWCKPLLCHGDILIELISIFCAEEGEDENEICVWCGHEHDGFGGACSDECWMPECKMSDENVANSLQKMMEEILKNK